MGKKKAKTQRPVAAAAEVRTASGTTAPPAQSQPVANFISEIVLSKTVAEYADQATKEEDYRLLFNVSAWKMKNISRQIGKCIISGRF